MSKRKCTKGYSCGKSCISVTRACLKEFPEGVSVALDDRSVVKPESKKPAVNKGIQYSREYGKSSYEDFEKVISPRVKVDDGKEKSTTRYKQGDITFHVETLRKDPDGWGYEYENLMENLEEKSGFNSKALELLKSQWNGDIKRIDWTSEEGKTEDPKDNLKRLLIARKLWKEKVLPNLSEGDLVYNPPEGGAGGSRDKIYQKSGFGRVDSSGHQFSMVMGGKLVPVEFLPPNTAYNK